MCGRCLCVLSDKELQILAYLRENGRHTVTQIGHKLGIPRTTVFDKIKKFKRLGLIKKFTCVVNFEELGHTIQANIFFKSSQNKVELSNALKSSVYTNTVLKLGNDYDLMASVMFPSMNELHEYLDRINQKYGVVDHKIFYIAKELKREGFMTRNQIDMNAIDIVSH